MFSPRTGFASPFLPFFEEKQDGNLQRLKQVLSDTHLRAVYSVNGKVCVILSLPIHSGIREWKNERENKKTQEGTIFEDFLHSWI